jgi:hypothetical protein
MKQQSGDLIQWYDLRIAQQECYSFGEQTKAPTIIVHDPQLCGRVSSIVSYAHCIIHAPKKVWGILSSKQFCGFLFVSRCCVVR